MEIEKAAERAETAAEKKMPPMCEVKDTPDTVRSVKLTRWTHKKGTEKVEHKESSFSLTYLLLLFFGIKRFQG